MKVYAVRRKSDSLFLYSPRLSPTRTKWSKTKCRIFTYKHHARAAYTTNEPDLEIVEFELTPTGFREEL